MIDPQALVQERLAHNSWGLLGSQGHILGIDLGGYGLRAALIDLHDHTYSSMQAPFSEENPEQAIAEAIACAKQLLASKGVDTSRLVRIGVGFGGPIDIRHGIIRLAPRRPAWENFPLQATFEQAFDATTLVDNDANLIALGEATFGVGKGYTNLFYLHLSSGVGGGLVLDGRLYHGATATAGEIGHAMVGAGKSATLEELVSIGGLLRRADELGLTTNNLADLFSDHPAAQQVVRETTEVLALRLAQVAALIDPQMIVLGGVVARIGGDTLVHGVAAQFNNFIAPAFVRPIPVVASVLGPDSIAIGCLALALESLYE